MLLSSLVLIFLPIITAAKPKCLPSGDERAINAALLAGGESATVELCPGSVHRLQNPVVLTAQRQTLTTEGNPPGRGRALLIVEGKTQSIAIKADCDDCSFVTIRNLEVDGNRPLLLRIKKGDALLELGNGVGQVVRNCRLYEPRGWSALHFREGNRLQCKEGLITANEIGPCGEEWDDEYDGTDELAPPFGSPNADGISLACKDSIVSHNVVYDTTDGAIVLFGSAGSEITENAIYSRTRIVLGGINLVDYPPWEGDYTGLKVHRNSFYALGRYLKVGIVIGPASWSDDTDSVVRGAAVYDNSFQGDHFGYAIVVSSAEGFSVANNKVDSAAKFGGVPGARCPTAPPNGSPVAYLINRGSAKGTFQDEFVNGEVQHIICIDPPPFLDQPFKPWRFRDDPIAVAAKATLDPKSQAVANAKLTDALVKYQLTLMNRLSTLEDQIEALDAVPQNLPPTRAGDDAAVQAGGGMTSADVAKLLQRIKGLESGQNKVRQEVQRVKDDWTSVSGKVEVSTAKQRRLVDYIARTIPSVYAGYPKSTSLFTQTLAVVESVYFGTLGGFIQLTLAIVGVNTLIRRLWTALRSKQDKDKLYKY